MPRIFTCTPVAFGGGPDFFARDSGLLCRGLQALGMDSRAIMPGPPQINDQPDLIRTDFKNLESADWWKSQQLDGVVLYAWGSPKFRKVARAIRMAGIFLILNQDNSGLISPLAGPADWFREQRILTGGSITGLTRKILRDLTIGIAVTDPLRAFHLHQGDIIACVSPIAAQRYRRLGKCLGRSLAARIHVIPHPVEPAFHHDESEKRLQIICVGRWDDEIQKRPEFLIRTLTPLLTSMPGIHVVIAGNPTPLLKRWHASLADTSQNQVTLAGRLNRAELAHAMRASRIFYSPSAFESFGIAAAEALCCGCSVVAGSSVSMAAFPWFVSEQSGTLASTDTPDAHLTALIDELNLWSRGGRDPHQIAAIWSSRLHSTEIAKKILHIQTNR